MTVLVGSSSVSSRQQCPPSTSYLPKAAQCRQLKRGPAQQVVHEEVQRRGLLTGLAGLFLTTLPRESEAAPKKLSSGDWSSPGLASLADDSSPGFFTTSRGVKVQELSAGSGPPAQAGDRIELDYVLRRSNGYFIYSTVEGVSFQPRDVPVGPFEFRLGRDNVIAGLQDAVTGMREGGKRRALVPPAAGYADDAQGLQPQPPSYAAQRQVLNHASEPLMFELKLLKIRRS